MLVKLHQLVAVVGWPQLVVIGALALLWMLEQYLAFTKRVKANSMTQAAFNALWSWAKLRYPLVYRLGNIADEIVVQVQQTTTTETTTATATVPTKTEVK